MHKIEPEVIKVKENGVFKLMICDYSAYDEEIPLLFEIDQIEPHIWLKNEFHSDDQYILYFKLKNPVKANLEEYKTVSFIFDEDRESFFTAYRYLKAILAEDYFLLDLYSIGEQNPFYNVGFSFDL